MSMDLAALNAAERGQVSRTDSSGSESDRDTEKDLSIPALQAVYLDIRCVPVFSEEACHCIDELARDATSRIERCKTLKKNGVNGRRLRIATRRKINALWKHYAFVKLADEVLGLERPSRASLAELRSFHRQEGIPVPKPLEDLDRDGYRLVSPKRAMYEKRLIEACHSVDWSKWFSWARLSSGWERVGATFSDEKIVMLAGAVTALMVCLAMMLPMALVPLNQLSPVCALLMCFLFMLCFGGMQIWLFEEYSMTFLVYGGFLATILQIRIGG
ncbi:hypothetical protein MAPG_09065 [Magnaporthiopsis poae ATCC 64411]|uniref:DUF6594 domain-containing protein n=1 Tax=Magnaporthiopsis poae (strain ATCC 64411 / 73-15) TaxID=644358 RepID=A0A0C4E8Z2_MAGP6|nr:hypothetical protein MAPG_09065 [Magnaporthiopsis poae ATCC 64411]